MVDFLLNGARGQQPVNGDLSGLSDAPRPLPGLGVGGGVPVRVVDDHPVRPRQIDAQAPNTGGQEEDEQRIILSAILQERRKWYLNATC